MHAQVFFNSLLLKDKTGGFAETNALRFCMSMEKNWGGVIMRIAECNDK